MALSDVFDAVVGGAPNGTSSPKIGESVRAYYKDKWRPGTLVELGRKWAYVQLAGNDYKSKVPIGAIRPIGTQGEAPPAPPPPAPAADRLTVAKEDGWLRIRRGTRLIALLPGAHKDEADAMFEALQRLDEGGE